MRLSSSIIIIVAIKSDRARDLYTSRFVPQLVDKRERVVMSPPPAAAAAGSEPSRLSTVERTGAALIGGGTRRATRHRWDVKSKCARLFQLTTFFHREQRTRGLRFIII